MLIDSRALVLDTDPSLNMGPVVPDPYSDNNRSLGVLRGEESPERSVPPENEADRDTRFSQVPD
jgi:hypothetical protein